MKSFLPLALLVALLPNFGDAAAGDARSQAIEVSLAGAAATFSVDVQNALLEIDGTPRRLLALRGYLRARDTLAARWSWSEAQIEAFERSSEYARMLAEIAKIDARFRQSNPGFSLYANTQVRSLGVQLERWNKNRTVGKVADDLYASVRQSADAESVEGLSRLLNDWRASAAIPLAVPGLSLHGQSRALDFQVRAGDRVIAGPDTASVARVWERQGWASRLAAAINASSKHFNGPLTTPNEPWHFQYTSESTDAAAPAIQPHP